MTAHLRSVIFIKLSLCLRVDAFEQSLHITNGVSGSYLRMIAHRRDVVGNEYAIKIHGAHRFQYLIHIHITIINKSFNEVWQRSIHIAEVYFEEFFAFAKIADGFKHIPAHFRTTLSPTAYTQTHSNIGTISDF